MPKAEFGVRLPVAGPLANREAIGRAAREADRLGFDAVWVHDFIIWSEHLDSVHISCGSAEALEAARASGSYEPQFYESLMSLAYVAGLTERARIGVAVLCLPFRNPIVTAKQVATLDQLSGGRLILGVGVGAAKGTGNQDFEVLGVPRGDKYRRTAEYLRVMEAIWTQDHPTYEGQYVSFPPTDINPKPAQKPHPPIWFGGAGPKSIDLTAEYGDGWIPGRVSIEQYPAKIKELRELASAKGRADAAITIASEIYVCIGKTSEQARQASQKTIETVTNVGGFAQLSAQAAFADHALIGSAEEVRDKVARYVEAGVQHFEMKFIYRDVDHLVEQLALFAEAVSPAFQE